MQIVSDRNLPSHQKQGGPDQRQLFLPGVLPHERILPEQSDRITKHLTASAKMLPGLIKNVTKLSMLAKMDAMAESFLRRLCLSSSLPLPSPSKR